jgi:homocysteine S-methyltransferase
MSSVKSDPILQILDHQRVMVLDGGLATALEARGCNLVDELWSARILMEDPDMIREVHLDYLEAGADCISTASYQASIQGFMKRGLDEASARALLALSVQLAREARELFWTDPSNRVGRSEPLVAASIGPFGAFLADGSEYTGRYHISEQELYQFHRERWLTLASAGADLLVCETTPAQREAETYLRLLAETQEQWAWISFSCKDGQHLRDGGLLRDAVRLCDADPRVVSVGVNCVAPEFVMPLIEEAKAATGKPVFVYPNSGEEYDPETKSWRSAPSSLSWREAVLAWVEKGASGVGGCCRVGPSTIAEIRRAVL